MSETDRGGRPVGPPSIGVKALAEQLNSCVSHYFKQLWVVGEVGQVNDRGHLYFVLKEGEVTLQAVVWSRDRRHLKHQPKEGEQVLVRGDVSIYPKRGSCTLRVQHIELTGEGLMLKELEDRRARLTAQGVFSRALPLPMIPRGVGLVTAQGSDGETDFLTTAKVRAPGVPIHVFDTRMQGPEQEVVAQIKEALKRASAHPSVDVLVLTRGGGALEDLWLFHNEDLCRFISQAPLPIVVAIGHEKNHLLAEEAGDARVSTPTYAAMRVIPDVRTLRQQLEPMIQALHVSLERQGGAKARRLAELTSVLSAPSLDRQRQRLEGVMYQLEVSARDALERKDRALSQAKQHLTERSPLAALARFDEGFKEGARALEHIELLAAPTTALTHSAERLESAAQAQLERATSELHSLIAELHALSPLAVLSRGYSITTRANSAEVLHDASSVSPGERVIIQLSEGRLEAEVTHVSPASST